MRNLAVLNFTLCNTLLKKTQWLEQYGARVIPYFLFLPELLLSLRLIKQWTGCTLPVNCLLTL